MNNKILKEQISYKNIDRGNMNVLLVSDPTTIKCAICLTVDVGSLDEGKYYGIAHLMEHVLIMRQDNKLFWFLHNHDGTFNAVTMNDKTSYFLDIWHPYFEQSVEIFSDILKFKKFERDFILKEIDTVNSEYSMNKSSDLQKIFAAFKDAYVANNVYKNFSVGSHESLDVPNIEEIAWKFYQKMYFGRKITMVLYGKQTIGEMETWIDKYYDIRFNPIQERQMLKWDELLEPGKNDYYRGLAVKTAIDDRQVYIVWYLPNKFQHMEYKPIDLLMYIVLDYSPNGLINYLILRKLLIKLEMESFEDFDDVSSFMIHLELTRAGWKNREMVLNIIFSYIYNIINNDVLLKSHYNELCRLNTNLYLLEGEEKPQNVARELSFNLFKYSQEHILNGDYYMNSDYDSIRDQLKNYLSKINPNNCVVIFMNQRYTDLPNTDKWFSAKYKKELFKLRENIVFNIRLVKNPFIPQIKCYSEYESNFDSFKIAPGNKLWYQFHMHNTPKLIYGMFIKFDQTFYFQNLILEQILRKEIKKQLYYLITVDCRIKIKTITNGMLIIIEIYPDFLDRVLPILEKLLSQTYTNDNLFTEAKQTVKRILKNTAMKSKQLMSDLLGEMMSKDHIGLIETIRGVEKTNNISNNPKIYRVHSLLYGNFSVIEIKKLLSFQDKMQIASAVETEAISYALPQKRHILIRNPNKGEVNNLILIFLPIGVIVPGKSKIWAHNLACLSMLANLMDGDFFDYIRVQKRLAYQLSSNLITVGPPNNPYYGISLIVKSDKGYQTVETEINSYLKNFPEKITSELVDLIKATTIMKYQEELLFGYKTFLNHFTAMIDETLLFEKEKIMIDTLKRLTHNDIKQFYQQYCCSNLVTIVFHSR